MDQIANGESGSSVRTKINNVLAGNFTATSSLASVGVTNKLTADGTFDTNTGWGVTSGWTISGGKATHTAGVTSLTGTTSMTNALVYRIVVTISGRTAGSLAVFLGTFNTGVVLSADGTHTFYGLCSPTTAIVFTPTTDFNGSIETVTLTDMVKSDTNLVLKATNRNDHPIEIRNAGDGDNIGIGLESLSNVLFDPTYVGAKDTSGPAGPYRGNNNIGVGDRCLRSVTTGKYNNGHGQECMLHLTTGINNTGMGDSALNNLATGNNNSAFGHECLTFAVATEQNTAVGAWAGNETTSGGYNTFIGANAGQKNQTGIENVAVGRSALNKNVTYSNNVAVGNNALEQCIQQGNTSIGHYSLPLLTSGYYMIAIGKDAGYGAVSANAPVTDTWGILIGFRASRSVASATVLTNYLAIGNEALVDKSNQFVFGNANVTEHLFRAGFLKAPGTPTYADNAAALTGGLVAGCFYKTATGELRIVV